MTPARALYRVVVPRSVRIAVWHLRKGLRNIHNRALWRESLKNCYIALGRHVSRVRSDKMYIYVDLRDHGVGLPLFLEKTYEPCETQFIKNVLRPGMVFVDVGANIGYFTVVAARAVGHAGKVVAFEPDPYNFCLLGRNVRTNRLRNVIVSNYALGASPGVARLRRSSRNYGDHRLYESDEERSNTVLVPIDTLDGSLQRHDISAVDVIKMDVQGYEHNVLTGMSNILGGNTPLVVLTEFWPYGIKMAGGEPKDFYESFLQVGFEPAVLTPNGTTLAVTWEDIQNALPPFDAGDPEASYLNLVFER